MSSFATCASRPPGLNVPTGENLTQRATSILTVGSDCAIGKMTVALELDREARRRGIRSEFVPTGQTGIAIAGWGISVDAVVADFIAGAAEQLVLEGARAAARCCSSKGRARSPSGVLRRHARPDPRLGTARLRAVSHGRGDDRRRRRRFTIPPLSRLVALHEEISLLPRRARVHAIALNTRNLDDAAARRAIAETEAETGLPADDPVRFGAGRLVDALTPLLAP